MQKLLVLGHAVIHLIQLAHRRLVVVRLQRLPGLGNEAVADLVLFAHQPLDARLQVHVLRGRGVRGRAGDDQRRTRLVDQNAVNLVDDREEMPALHHLGRLDCHAVVTQIVETELAVGAVGHIAGVLLAPLGRAHVVLDAADRQAEVFQHMPHPLRVAAGQVVVDRHQAHILSGERVEVERQRCHQRFALAGLHFGDLALMQHDAADKLHVKRHHVPRQRVPAHFARGAAQPPAGIFHCGKRLAQQIVQRLPLCHALLKSGGLGFELIVRQRLVRFLQFVDLIDQRLHPLQITVVFRSKNRFNQIHVSTLRFTGRSKPPPQMKRGLFNHTRPSVSSSTFHG